MNVSKTLTLVLSVILLAGCTKTKTDKTIKGLKPIYGTVADLQSLVSSLPPRELKTIGKIYTFNGLLFVNELGEGVHIFDNSDPTKPTKLKFLSIPGNIDIAIRDQNLYADMGSGLATIDISNLDNLKITHFDTNHISQNLQQRPPSAMLERLGSGKIYFECTDASKGQIVAWTTATLTNPECYLNN